MNVKLALASLVTAAALASAHAAYAQAPSGSTGLCKDGTYSSAEKKRGACAGHGGVKQWYGTHDAEAPSASPPPGSTARTPEREAATHTPTARAHEKPSTASESAAREQPKTSAASERPALGGGNGKVWANTATKVYHCQGDRYYGNTKHGEYMSESQARDKGYHASHGKACA
jgi:hypothetical protein